MTPSPHHEGMKAVEILPFLSSQNFERVFVLISVDIVTNTNFVVSELCWLKSPHILAYIEAIY